MIQMQLTREWEQMRNDVAPWDPSTTLEQWWRAVARRPDETLSHLIELAQAGQVLAARVIVQALWPKLAAMSRREARADVGDFVTHLWLRIASYDLERRPHKIAANLTLDAWKQVRKERRPLPTSPLVSVADEEPAFLDEECSAREILQRAKDHRLITESTWAVLVSVYVRELSHREVATQHGLSEVAVRQRCSKAVRRLAAERELWEVAA